MLYVLCLHIYPEGTLIRIAEGQNKEAGLSRDGRASITFSTLGGRSVSHQAYALRTTADPVMRRSATETCLPIHPVQFWSVGISFVNDGLVLKIPA